MRSRWIFLWCPTTYRMLAFISTLHSCWLKRANYLISQQTIQLLNREHFHHSTSLALYFRIPDLGLSWLKLFSKPGKYYSVYTRSTWRYQYLLSRSEWDLLLARGVICTSSILPLVKVMIYKSDSLYVRTTEISNNLFIFLNRINSTYLLLPI